MSDSEYPVVVIGGGMVGLSFALSLADAGVSVLVVDAKAPSLAEAKTSMMGRVSAINASSVKFLNQLGAWPHLSEASFAPFTQMKVWDTQGDGEIHFHATDVARAQLGYIVENAAITRQLWRQLVAHPHIEVKAPAQAISWEADVQGVYMQLSDGSSIKARLVVGADGAASWVRQQAKIPCDKRSYGQVAITGVVMSEKPHAQCAWQQFLTEGPLGVLPLRDPHLSSFVWSNSKDRAQALMEMPVEQFNVALMNAAQCYLGDMKLVSVRTDFPLVMQHATAYITPQVALLGDAAHAIHPLAGQGANLGLSDAACLSHAMSEAIKQDKDPLSWRVLRAYARARRFDNTRMQGLIRMLSDLFSVDDVMTVGIRSAGMKQINQRNVLKRLLIEQADGIGVL